MENRITELGKITRHPSCVRVLLPKDAVPICFTVFNDRLFVATTKGVYEKINDDFHAVLFVVPESQA